MLTPYDWQEGIGHRAQYIEGRLQSGVPAAAVAIPDGVLMASFRHRSPKTYEIYDHIAMSGMGIQGDIEAVRVASIDFCHREGYQRSEQDVNVRRLVSAMSEPVKNAFGNFRAAPIVFKGLFAEVGEELGKDALYVLDYDGDFGLRRDVAWLSGTQASYDSLKADLGQQTWSDKSLDDACAILREAVLKAMDPDGSRSAEGELPELSFEAALLDRNSSRERRFRFVVEEQEQ